MSIHFTNRPVPAVFPPGVAPEFPMGSDGWSLVVSGAGTEAVNGTYREAGPGDEGSIRYDHAAQDVYWIGWNTGMWAIHSRPDSLWLYAVPGPASGPVPESGWEVHNATAPAPGVSNT